MTGDQLIIVAKVLLALAVLVSVVAGSRRPEFRKLPHIVNSALQNSLIQLVVGLVGVVLFLYVLLLLSDRFGWFKS
jgi:hypothetical protein